MGNPLVLTVLTTTPPCLPPHHRAAHLEYFFSRELDSLYKRLTIIDILFENENVGLLTICHTNLSDQQQGG